MFFWAIPILRLKQFCLVTRLTLFSIFTGRIEKNDKPWTLTREELKYVAHRTFMISYVFVWIVALWFLRYFFVYLFFLFLCTARSFERLYSLAIPVFRWCRSCVAHIWQHLGSRGRVVLTKGCKWMQRKSYCLPLCFYIVFFPLCLCGESELSHNIIIVLHDWIECIHSASMHVDALLLNVWFSIFLPCAFRCFSEGTKGDGSLRWRSQPFFAFSRACMQRWRGRDGDGKPLPCLPRELHDFTQPWSLGLSECLKRSPTRMVVWSIYVEFAKRKEYLPPWEHVRWDLASLKSLGPCLLTLEVFGDPVTGQCRRMVGYSEAWCARPGSPCFQETQNWVWKCLKL